MAHVGVFALCMSRKTGGVMSFFDGLMTSAEHSRHTFTYYVESGCVPRTTPANVELVVRPPMVRRAVQALLSVPGVSGLLGSREVARAFVARSSASPLGSVDAWIWPHCFFPVPNLGSTVTVCHDLIHRQLPENFTAGDHRRRLAGERSLRHCEVVLSPSEATARDLRAAHPELGPKITTFSEAAAQVEVGAVVDAEMVRLRDRYEGAALFVYVAVDWPHKNHALLVEAARRLRVLTDRPFRVVFAGYRRTDAVGALLRESDADDLVEDLGPVSRAELSALMRVATALVFPSRSEGFGIPLVEAMQCGLPIIASDHPCIAEITGSAGVTLSPDEPDAWARTMARMLDDAPFRDRLAEASSARSALFSWSASWRAIDEAIDRAVRSTVSTGQR